MKQHVYVTLELDGTRIRFNVQTPTNSTADVIHNDGSAYSRIETHVQNALRTTLRTLQKAETKG